MKKYICNYIELLHLLGLSQFYGFSTKEQYFNETARDIPRTPLFHPFGTASEHMTLLAEDKSSGEYQYSQGDFDGGFFSVLSILYSKLWQSVYDGNDNYESIIKNNKKVLRLSYIDDDGILCAFCCSIVKGWEENQGKYFFNLCIIRNTTAPPNQRQVIFISDKEIMPDSDDKLPPDINIKRQDISNFAVSNEVKKFLNSKYLNNHIQRLCNGTEDSFNYLQTLDKCFKPSSNADFDALNRLSAETAKLRAPWVYFALQHPTLTAGLLGLIVGALFLLSLVAFGAAIGFATVTSSIAAASIAGSLFFSSNPLKKYQHHEIKVESEYYDTTLSGKSSAEK